MAEKPDRAWVQELLRRNRYLVLSTSDGKEPWIAPLEHLVDAELNLYFFSPEDVKHTQHIESNHRVAVAVFDNQQPEYSPGASVTLNGLQIEGTASRLSEAEYTEDVVAAIEALKPPMPPYAVYKITPTRFYVPRIEDGINVRSEVSMS